MLLRTLHSITADRDDVLNEWETLVDEVEVLADKGTQNLEGLKLDLYVKKKSINLLKIYSHFSIGRAENLSSILPPPHTLLVFVLYGVFTVQRTNGNSAMGPTA